MVDLDRQESLADSSSPLSILNPGQIFPLWRPLITRTCVGGLTANLFAGNGAEGGKEGTADTDRVSPVSSLSKHTLGGAMLKTNGNHYGYNIANCKEHNYAEVAKNARPRYCTQYLQT